MIALNEFGLLVDALWKDLPNHYPGLQLGAWVVMPNHIHGVLILTQVGAIHESPANESSEYKPPLQEPPLKPQAMQQMAIHESTLPEPSKRDERRKMLLSKIIGRFKMTTGKQINLLRKTPGTATWQRNYYEHIIRNDKSFINIANYIVSNPENWNADAENIHPKNL